MDTRKLIPYSVYLPVEHHTKLKAIAQNRKASELIRNAIQTLLDGNDAYNSGYNQGIKDAIEVVLSNDEAMNISIKDKKIGVKIADDLKTLERSK